MEVKLNQIIISSSSAPVSLASVQQTRDDLPTEVPVDFTNFPGTPDELQRAKALIQKYRNIFVQEGDHLGCTPSIMHKIRTTDDTPVSQPFRRILPGFSLYKCLPGFSLYKCCPLYV